VVKVLSTINVPVTNGPGAVTMLFGDPEY